MRLFYLPVFYHSNGIIKRFGKVFNKLISFCISSAGWLLLITRLNALERELYESIVDNREVIESISKGVRSREDILLLIIRVDNNNRSMRPYRIDEVNEIG